MKVLSGLLNGNKVYFCALATAEDETIKVVLSEDITRAYKFGPEQETQFVGSNLFDVVKKTMGDTAEFEEVVGSFNPDEYYDRKFYPAPKDGTTIIVASDERDAVEVRWNPEKLVATTEDGETITLDGMWFNEELGIAWAEDEGAPTHWRPTGKQLN